MRHPLSNEALADFFGTKPADQEYSFQSPSECAIAQYFDSIGLPYSEICSGAWRDCNGCGHALPEGWNRIVALLPNTFGAAHKRARECLSQ